ncbi:MAG: hypothetical protein AAFQ35_07170 [Pseudomonadota bacterium]
MDDYAAMETDLSPRRAASITKEEHTWAVQAFEDAAEARRTNRQNQQRDRDYYDNKQLTETEIEALRERGQPATIINRIAPKVDFLLGLETQQRTDPRAFPRTPQDEEAAEAATDALRYVKEAQDLNDTFSLAWEDMIIAGHCTAEVNIKETPRGIDVWITHHPWDFAFADPHSRRHDYTDARYLGVVKWMDQDDAAEQWPHAREELDGMFAEERATDFEDKPEWKTWTLSGNRRRVRVVQMCWRKGATWKWAIFCKGVVLAGGDVPFLDGDQEPECPLIMQSAYIDQEGNRYGAVRKLIGPQDEINARRSKLLHMLHNRQTWGREGAVDDVDEVKRQLNRADGHVEMNGEFGADWGFLDSSIQMNGQAELLQEAKSEIDLIGANNALQGKDGGAASGRAIQASQQGGLVEIAVLTNRHRAFKNRVYRAVWNRVRQYWTDEKWVRVTDDEENVKFVGFNRTIDKADKLIEDAERQGMPKQEATARLQQALQENPAIEADLRTQVTVNVAAEMDMDINVEEVPDVVSLQQEQFDELSKLLSSGMPLEDPRMRLLIMSSSLRDKSKLLEQLDGQKAPTPEQQQAQQMQQAMAQAQIEKAMLDNEKIKAEIAEMSADNDDVDPAAQAAEPNEQAMSEAQLQHQLLQNEQARQNLAIKQAQMLSDIALRERDMAEKHAIARAQVAASRKAHEIQDNSKPST